MLHEFESFFTFQVERIFKTYFTLNGLSLKIGGAYQVFNLETMSANVGSH